MPCNNCGNDLPIINKKYGLCNNCNSLRLHNKSISERQAESSRRYLEKSKERYRRKVSHDTELQITTIKRSPKPIRKQTRKEAAIKSQLSQVKFDIELEAIQNDEYYCKGCGCSKLGLDKSHLLSIGRFKHLELIKENIQLLCRSCHLRWESGTIEEQISLHCFADNLAFIYYHDKETFNKFITRIEEYLKWLVPEKDQDKISLIETILATVEEKI